MDPVQSNISFKSLQEFDADPNVLVAIAHDPASLEVFEFFPNATMNDWKRKGYKEAVHWGFLNELPYNAKCKSHISSTGCTEILSGFETSIKILCYKGRPSASEVSVSLNFSSVKASRENEDV